MSSEALQRIDGEISLYGLSHIVFCASEPRTAIEKALSSILQELKDSSTIVEYWWREEWLSLDLHRDVDEELAIVNNTFRYPNNAHVLYLSIGDAVEGPTIVIQEKDSNTISDGEWTPHFSNITIVPAVTGRLLRFDGHLLHAVPRPALAYLDEEEGGSNWEVWTRRRPNPNDPNDPERTTFRRSVLLFNTWPDDHGPTGVSSNIPKEAIPMSNSDLNTWRLSHCKRYDEWNEIEIQKKDDNQNYNSDNSNSEQYSMKNNKDIDCDSNQISIKKGGESKLVHMSLYLLGNLARRKRSSRTLSGLYSPREIKDAFQQRGGAPVVFPLWRESTK